MHFEASLVHRLSVNTQSIQKFSTMVNVDVNMVNYNVHSRANFRPRVDHVFTVAMRPGRLTGHDADVPVNVFLILIFEFPHASM